MRLKRFSASMVIVLGFVLIVSLWFTTSTPAPQTSSLSGNDFVVVDYWTSGCNHRQHYLLTLRSSPRVATIEMLEDAGRVPAVPVQRQISITSEELGALDGYLQTCRSWWGRTGRHTEFRHFSMVWFRQGRMFHRETHDDARPDGQMSFEYFVRRAIPDERN